MSSYPSTSSGRTGSKISRSRENNYSQKLNLKSVRPELVEGYELKKICSEFSMIITLDGPVASGKSTVSRMLAHRLHYYYLNSGALYRALGYLLVHQCGCTQESIAHPHTRDIATCFDPHRFSYVYDDIHQERIFFDGKDITPYLKDRFVDNIASVVSVDPHVREAVTAIQRHIASHHNIVTDGRDVGSVVFADADVKFFITASVEVRARRWQRDQERYGNHVSVDEAIKMITERDNRDTQRTIAPLIIPERGIVIDTSELTKEQTVEKMLGYISNF
jgi:CMP/dCMP kinase